MYLMRIHDVVDLYLSQRAKTNHCSKSDFVAILTEQEERAQGAAEQIILKQTDHGAPISMYRDIVPLVGEKIITDVVDVRQACT